MTNERKAVPDHKEMIRDLLDDNLSVHEDAKPMNDWENEFLTSLHDRVNKYKRELSDKQGDILEKIYDRFFPKF